MVNWSDPSQIQRAAVAYDRVIYCVLGVVMWEVSITCGFEWSIITRRRPFRWPLSESSPTCCCLFDSLSFLNSVFFFLSRYCIVMAIIGLIASITVTSELNCGALYTFISWAGNMTMLCASTSLMLRTIALWERKLSVVIPLGALCIAFWGILYRTMFIVRAQWDDSINTCAVVQTNPSLLKVTFLFTMCFDFVILVYTFVALIARHTARTDLWKLLFQDGLVYFVVTFTANCIPAVFNVLNLNTPMNVIATIPAAAISSIASGRAVMRLLQYRTADSVQMHSIDVVGATPPASRHRPAFSVRVTVPKAALTRPEVLVTTEHITVSEFRDNRPSDSKNSLDVDLELGRR